MPLTGPAPTLARALAALADLPARRAVLRETIAKAPLAAARAIEAVLRAAMNGSASGRDAAVVLASTLVAMWEEGAARPIAALHHAALDDGLPVVASLLFDAPAPRVLAKRGRLAEIGLPERHDFRFWSLARERGMAHFYLHLLHVWSFPRILFHPSPIFIERLLRQRWIDVPQVLVIASRRPTSAAIVSAIVRHDGWIQRMEVREALVQNPFVPTGVVLALLPSVRYRVLRHVRDAGAAHPAASRAAGLLLGLGGR